MKKLFLLVAMAFITSVASAQISAEKFNQMNINISKQAMENKLSYFGFAYNSNQVLVGVIGQTQVEISFTVAENGLIEEMQVRDVNTLNQAQYNQRMNELQQSIRGQEDRITIESQGPTNGRYRIIQILR